MSRELEIMKEERERLVQEDYADSCIEECDLVIKALQRLESIDNAKPSEALECLEKIDDRFYLIKYRTTDGGNKEEYEFCPSDTKEYDVIENFLLKAEKEHNSINLLMQELDCKDFAELRKYARCGYEKLNKQYLKWEDLEFKEERQEIPVRMGETTYTLVLRKTDGGNKIAKLLSPKRNYMGEWGDMFYEEAKQFFNDLHLERVEE